MHSRRRLINCSSSDGRVSTTLSSVAEQKGQRMTMFQVAFYHQDSRTARRSSSATYQWTLKSNRKLRQLFSFWRLQTRHTLMCDLRRRSGNAADLLRQSMHCQDRLRQLLQCSRCLTEM